MKSLRPKPWISFRRWLIIRLGILAVLAALAYFVAGPGALVLVVAVGWVVALFWMRLALPAPVEQPVPPRPPADLVKWPSLERISSELTWASTSTRHFDLGPRKVLQRVAAARLAERLGIDLWAQRDRAAAAAAIGPSWPLIDPDRPASRDSHDRGVPGADIDALLDRLDNLSRSERR